MEQNIQKTALLVMDMQGGILRNLPDSTALVANVAKAVAAARIAKIPVIYVVVGFRPGAPEISLNNKLFGANGKERFLNMDMAAFMKIHPDLEPRADEPVVTKRRFSAFTGSDLEVILRAYRIEHLVLTGVSTSGVVLSTSREAADKDYRITIVADCCADADEEVHRVLTEKVFLRQADVVSLQAWTAGH